MSDVEYSGIWKEGTSLFLQLQVSRMITIGLGIELVSRGFGLLDPARFSREFRVVVSFGGCALWGWGYCPFILFSGLTAYFNYH